MNQTLTTYKTATTPSPGTSNPVYTAPERLSYFNILYNLVTWLSQFSSVAQSCLTLCDPVNHSMPGLPVHHQFLEFTQTHVHPASDAIKPSHPLSSPSPPAPNPSQHQGLFQWVNSSHEVAKVLEFWLQHQSFQWYFLFLARFNVLWEQTSFIVHLKHLEECLGHKYSVNVCSGLLNYQKRQFIREFKFSF